ncbi:UDP-galactopyranose mutase [Solemya pervernicosa gill symbiont]|uniref:UDP-galactopyranose mutase n=2 Tax=Gammaproteobacteria incertae sedis TaxID=118884 RepID=A0A1T2L765_9GAMM|nr:UDP-galactopyranose mutase [Candidatus Reidiella endopervernicosa]OOZ40947.1 UDP-galactopyranose mutase [Solemya pervernicosa gill symbiont]QKQ24996.1 UDP-galactopyranose mutase [Candidatus Reidiella endopervernicosa]
MKTEWLVVGAGLTGATLAEQIATRRGESVLVVDQRNHVAGNAFDEEDECGITVHRYGPHIFHTNSRVVWDYLSKFTEWHSYRHHVLGSIDGEYVPLPVNLNSIEKLFPKQMSQRYIEKLLNTYCNGERVPILQLMESSDSDIRAFAESVYQRVFEQYSLKQWGVEPEQLLPSVTARVPVSLSRDDGYFQDTYQAIPVGGYTAMVNNMLDHPNIEVMLGAEWEEIQSRVEYKRLVFTGSIDQYFGYKFGRLPYRSIDFKYQTLPISRFQKAGVVNYPNDHDYTRVTEFTQLTGQSSTSTTLLYEYPVQHEPGMNTPCYPMPIRENRSLLRRYKDEAEKISESVLFAGRLGDYMYYNMDQVVARALKLASTL